MTKLMLPEAPRANGYYIDGKWFDGENRDRLDRVSPGHGITVSSVALCTEQDTDIAVQAARRAFEDVWADTPGAERGRILIRSAQGIREPSGGNGLLGNTGNRQADQPGPG